MTAPRFLRDALGVAASQYLARAALLARGVVAAAAFGPQGYGHWNALHLVLDYGPYATAGAVQGLDLALPAASARRDRALEARLVRGAWTAAAVGGAAFALAIAVDLALGDRTLAGGFGAGAVALMAFAALLQIVVQVQAAALRARGRFDAVSLGAGLQALIGGVAGVALVWPLGVWGLLGGWLGGTLVAIAIQRVAARDLPWTPGEPAVALALARAGFPVFAFFALSLVLRSVDRIALVTLGDAAGLGLYSIGLIATGLVLYLPESAAFVLYPRVAAAAHGARDAAATRAEVVRVHRALGVFLPPLVATGMVWVGPVVALALPAFRDGVPVVHRLAVGALLLSAATVPAYFLLASGRHARLLVSGALATAFAAIVVFATASADPRPGTVAIASVAGYAAFALALVALAARELCAGARERAAFAIASFVPPLWAGAAALAACAVGDPHSAGASLARTVAVAAACAPVAWWFGRGLGVRALFAARRGPGAGGA